MRAVYEGEFRAENFADTHFPQRESMRSRRVGWER
jgi:predicted DNA-binding transcriptional regulator AlpA